MEDPKRKASNRRRQSRAVRSEPKRLLDDEFLASLDAAVRDAARQKLKDREHVQNLTHAHAHMKFVGL